MSYTDAEMLLFTQIAYMDVPGYMQDNRYTLPEIIRIREAELTRIRQNGTLTEAQQSQLNTINNFKRIAEREHIDYSNWSIRDVQNDQNTTGMYACVIDTGDGNAAIGFRGSESYDVPQIIRDWGASDLGLLNSTMTPQQYSAQEYTKYVYEKYGNEYDSFSFSGHSLGGNLAEHASLTAPAAMHDIIDRTISFDGPGFSEEYMIAHSDVIGRYGGKVDHYQWSVIGALLYPVPGSHYVTIEAEDPAFKSGDWPPFLRRHGTENVHFNADGSAKTGGRDMPSMIIDPISKGVENINLLLHPMSILIPITIFAGHQLEKFIRDVDAFSHKLVTDINQWFESRFQTTASGEYDVWPDALLETGASYASVAREIRAISEEVEQIRRNLRYDGVAGFYYKNKLGNIGNKINADAGKCIAAGNVLQACAQDYSVGDQAVAGMYA